jgi:hypothetical protein
MANPTSNFGWQMPTPTDLVTDLPADFEVFGQAVDTSLADLKGGTSGQVLSKNSNTDMDFVWVTSDDANAIQNAIVDAKGDLIAASANDTPARLAVGANGETLLADSSTSTGLRYQATQAAGKNAIINGNFDVWQRGTSFSPIPNALTYLADRWCAFPSTGVMAASRQLTGLTGFQYGLRYQRIAGQTNTGNQNVSQSIESSMSIPFGGKTVVLSFYAKCGANYSPTSSILRSTINSGTGTDQNVITGFTGSASVAQNNTVTTTYQRFSMTYAVPSNATQLSVAFTITGVGTAGADDWFEVAGVQLEMGSVATEFTRAGGTIQGELAACQRYYIRTTSTGTDSNHGIGLANSTTQAYIHANIAEMRVIPTSVDYANLNVSDTVTNFTFSGLSINAANSTPRLAFLIATGASGMTQFRPLFMRNNNNTAGYLGFSAEL